VSAGGPRPAPSGERLRGLPIPSAGVIVHYGELALKGGNRRSFERRLADRLREALEHAAIDAKVVSLGQRFLAVPSDAGLATRALTVLTRVPGVAHVATARLVAPDVDAMGAAALDALAAEPPGSFKLEARRANKEFPLNSIEVCRAVGAVAATSGRRVDVHAPDVTVRLEVLHGGAVVSAGRVPGPGGLPVGSSGKLLAFLSGGLDSPVAAWQMLRRGARLTAVHFWNRSLGAAAVREKIEDLCRVLAWSAGELPLVVVPFEACQRAIVAVVPAPARMLVYRRAMLRIGAALAADEKALGIVTGDSLGQVASQTAENLRAVLAAATLPVYQPLIGSDKAEIVALARRIGTYDVSIRPHDDCCSFLNSPHPETKSSPAQLDRLEQGLDWPALVAEALSGATRQGIRPVQAV
jgi:tRNA uracil 4-sulfurtransferase